MICYGLYQHRNMSKNKKIVLSLTASVQIPGYIPRQIMVPTPRYTSGMLVQAWSTPLGLIITYQVVPNQQLIIVHFSGAQGCPVPYFTLGKMPWSVWLLCLPLCLSKPDCWGGSLTRTPQVWIWVLQHSTTLVMSPLPFLWSLVAVEHPRIGPEFIKTVIVQGGSRMNTPKILCSNDRYLNFKVQFFKIISKFQIQFLVSLFHFYFFYLQIAVYNNCSPPQSLFVYIVLFIILFLPTTTFLCRLFVCCIPKCTENDTVLVGSEETRAWLVGNTHIPVVYDS